MRQLAVEAYNGLHDGMQSGIDVLDRGVYQVRIHRLLLSHR